MLCTSLNFMTEPLTEDDIERVGIEQIRKKERRRSRKGREKETKEKGMMCIKLDWLVQFEEQLSKKFILYSEFSVSTLADPRGAPGARPPDPQIWRPQYTIYHINN